MNLSSLSRIALKPENPFIDRAAFGRAASNTLVLYRKTYLYTKLTIVYIMLIEIRQTAEFEAWLKGVKDRPTLNRVLVRLKRMQHGHFGDTRSVGDGVSELRIHRGPGYRLYYLKRGQTAIVLLCAGDKGSQRKDIHRAKQISRDLELGP